MAGLDPEHLLDQAQSLVSLHLTRGGAPRQADLRRAISCTYYAIFHAILGATADDFIGTSKRKSSRYALLYRSVSHRLLRVVCEEVIKPSPSIKYRPFEPAGGFGPDVQQVAKVFIELQDKRHEADYYADEALSVIDVRLTIDAATAAIRRLRGADRAKLQAFLTLVVFQPR